MAKGFRALGHCVKCGDTQGPWSLYPGWGWVCDQCAEEIEEDKNGYKNYRRSKDISD